MLQTGALDYTGAGRTGLQLLTSLLAGLAHPLDEQLSLFGRWSSGEGNGAVL